MPLNPRRACVNCGDPVRGAGDLCGDCLPAPPAPDPGTAVCPYCQAANPWEKMRRYRRDLPDGRVEVLYYCPACRGILESASWMER